MNIEQLSRDLVFNKEDIKSKVIQKFSLNTLSSWDINKWTKEILGILSTDFSDIIVDFAKSNKDEYPINNIIQDKFGGNFDKYLDNLYSCSVIQELSPYFEIGDFMCMIENFSRDLCDDLFGKRLF